MRLELLVAGRFFTGGQHRPVLLFLDLVVIVRLVHVITLVTGPLELITAHAAQPVRLEAIVEADGRFFVASLRRAPLLCLLN